MNPFAKVQAGQPLAPSATAWNGLIDMFLAWRRGEFRNLDRYTNEFNQADIIEIRNDTGYNLDQLGVVGIDVPLILPTNNAASFKKRVVNSGVLPDDATHSGKFAIMLDATPKSEIGRAWAAGVCPAYINVTSTGLNFADVLDGSVTYLQTISAGTAQILWRESGTGPKFAIIRFCGSFGQAVATRISSTTANADGMYPGYIQEYGGGTSADISDGEACYHIDLNP